MMLGSALQIWYESLKGLLLLDFLREMQCKGLLRQNHALNGMWGYVDVVELNVPVGEMVIVFTDA